MTLERWVRGRSHRALQATMMSWGLLTCKRKSLAATSLEALHTDFHSILIKSSNPHIVTLSEVTPWIARTPVSK